MSDKEYSNIGQLVYTEELECLGDPYALTSSDKTYVTSEDGGFKFTDICLDLDSNNYYKKDQDYYFNLDVKQWKTEEVVVDILLENTDSSLDNEYQFLKRVVIPREQKNSENENQLAKCTAIMYQKKEEPLGEIKYTWVKQYDPEIPAVEGNIYFKDGNYCIYTNNSFIPMTSDNSYRVKTKVFSSFDEDELSDSTYKIEGIFSPLKDNSFNRLRFKIHQTVEDYIENGEIGKKLTFGENILIYPLNQLLPPSDLKAVSEIRKIGVWGNQGLRLAINGEEIRIGPSGYYEMDIIPIYRLGVAAGSGTGAANKNDFTIDYLY